MITFRDEAEAIRLANDTPYGLSGSLWTSDGARQLRVARALRTGGLGVNSNSSVFPQAPFGGYKQSGVGKELGMEGLVHNTELKSVFISTESVVAPVPPLDPHPETASRCRGRGVADLAAAHRGRTTSVELSRDAARADRGDRRTRPGRSCAVLVALAPDALEEARALDRGARRRARCAGRCTACPCW